MANRERGESTITVAGKEYTLVLDSNAMVAMEAAASTPERPAFFSNVMQLAQRGSWTNQRILVWASLRRHHPEVSLTEAGDLMLQSATEEMDRTMTELAGTASPDPSDLKTLGVKSPNPPAAQGARRKKSRGGTGTVSTDTAAASV